MNVFPDGQLPFWPFFHQLEQHLSYERWIDKYKLFLQLLLDSHISYDDEGDALLSACKILYLQDIKDEDRFTQLFRKTWSEEKSKWEAFFKTIEQETQKEPVEKNNSSELQQPPSESSPAASEPAEIKKEEKKDTISQQESKNEEKIIEEKENYYFTPSISFDSLIKDDESPQDTTCIPLYNFQDEYLPINRREMIKGWQYLRRHEKGKLTSEIDIYSTVKKIARENIFTEPEYLHGLRNREDTIIFFVDCNGSMMPFHELSRRLVKSARNFGGHKNAPVYYFQNAPTDYVFNEFQLTSPIKIAQALSKTNYNFSIAVVISDVGFARGYGAPERHKIRWQQLQPFLKQLNENCAHILWLNPVPENRWHEETAQNLKKEVLKMASIFDAGMNPFQTITRTLLKYQNKT
ncbi:hypothetical protein [Chryseobacterium viscerum]|uniref:VWA containing CoxE family protein n=1 Tax=Chryseobacterium viscerum TaxID=1037377 RepID=A0A316W9Z4_9FLAO|nr:hypothetical protein [Chryseobacterium viscerum]PWN58037.1 hypothetical protein C1634_024725 [Chryseobacterium viscerum]